MLRSDIKVCVVMPTFQRKKITIESLLYLKRQTVQLHKIILVGSCDEDRSIISEVNGIDYVDFSNQVLGSKIQAGFDFARQFNPDAVMICGSDDWLSSNWVEVLFPYLENYDWVGINKAYCVKFFKGEEIKILDVSYINTSRYCEPLGPGRIYSSRALDKLNWELYRGIVKSMDGNSYKALERISAKKYLYEGDEVKLLGIAGEWNCLTPWSRLAIDQRYPMIRKPKQWLLENFPHFFDVQKMFFGG